ncbi:MAG: hypothetical protein M3Q70_03130 [bacterium]|nr:hypothetical protein [bacterium]
MARNNGMDELVRIGADLQLQINDEKNPAAAAKHVAKELRKEAEKCKLIGSPLVAKGFGIEEISLDTSLTREIPDDHCAIGILGGFVARTEVEKLEEGMDITNHVVHAVISRELVQGAEAHLCPIGTAQFTELNVALDEDVMNALESAACTDTPSLTELKDIIDATNVNPDVVSFTNILITPKHLANFVKPEMVLSPTSGIWMRYKNGQYWSVKMRDYFAPRLISGIGADLTICRAGNSTDEMVFELGRDFSYF